MADLVRSGARVSIKPFASSFAVDQLVRWMSDGSVGTPQAIEIDVAFATWPRSWQRGAASWLDGRKDGGFTREVVSHFLFLSRRTFGPLMLHEATCTCSRRTAASTPSPRACKRARSPLLKGSVGGTDKDDHNTWTLTGAEGRIRLRDWSFAEREVAGRWQEAPDAIPSEKARPLVLGRQLDKVAALTRGEATNLATLEDALDVQRVVEAILRA